MKVFLNPSPIESAEELPEIPYVDTMCVNETEAALLSGAEETEDWLETAKLLCEKYKVKNTIITLGGDGACAWGERGSGSTQISIAHGSYKKKERKDASANISGWMR